MQQYEITQKLETCYAAFKMNPTEDNSQKLSESFLLVCRECINECNLDAFEKTFKTIQNVGLLDNPIITKELPNLFFLITNKLDDKILNNQSILDRIFDLMMVMNIKKNSREYVMLYKSIHKYRRIWKNYLEFCNWWGFENFNELDFIRNNTQMSLAETALIGYAKRLAKTNFQEDLSRLAMTFIEKSQKHKLTVYSNYYIAKLLFKLGISGEAIRRVLRPFILQKSSKPWAWRIFSKTFTYKDFNNRYCCLLMALSCGKIFNEQIYSKVYLDLAELFQYNNKLDNAKFFYEKYYSIQKKNNITIPQSVIQEMSEEWYKKVTPQRPDTSINYKMICTKLINEIIPADRNLYANIYRYLRDNFKETIQWSDDWKNQDN